MYLVEVLQEKINEIAKEKYKSDECPPKYTVSILYENKTTHKIMLTVQHLGQSFSTILFPQPEMKYGYESLEWEIEQMYNQTM
jgi:hypothetical protein